MNGLWKKCKYAIAHERGEILSVRSVTWELNALFSIFSPAAFTLLVVRWEIIQSGQQIFLSTLAGKSFLTNEVL